MKILISNDDGFESPGIRELGKALSKLGQVTIVAPHRERSTSGHSLTLHKPLRITKVEESVYATSGSPADCIYLGIREILGAKPDVIVSGINRGANLGTDVHYSGTVAAAREGALLDIPSFAFSLVDLTQIRPEAPQEPYRFEQAAQIAARLVGKLSKVRFPKHTFLNINIPNLPEASIRGMRFARQGFRYYSNEVTRRSDPRGKDYYWIGGAYTGFQQSAECDCSFVNEDYVVVTPLTIDCTHNEFYTTLKASTDLEKW